jgi:tetratricopeptide (TPR) repeat protein
MIGTSISTWYSVEQLVHNRGNKPEDRDKAIEDYTRAIEIDPDFTEGYFQRAGLLSAKAKSAEAIADYGEAIDAGYKASSAYYSPLRPCMTFREFIFVELFPIFVSPSFGLQRNRVIAG